MIRWRATSPRLSTTSTGSTPHRDHERLISLVQHQIEHVCALTAKPLNEDIRRWRAKIERGVAARSIDESEGGR
jgi:hypothetical protein